LFGIFMALYAAGASPVVWASEAQAQLKLSEAVSEALEKNPEIQFLRQRLQVFSARAKQAPYLEDPEIAFQLGGVPLANPSSFNKSDTNSIGIRQKVPFFGKLGLKEKIAQQEVKVTEQDLRAKEREVISMVKMAYADLFMAQKTIEILREQLEIMRTVIRATEVRYQVGRVTQQDVFKALLEQSEIMNQLINVEAESNAAQAKLNSAMYRPPRSKVELPGDLTTPSVDLNLPGLDELAMTNRPDLSVTDMRMPQGAGDYVVDCLRNNSDTRDIPVIVLTGQRDPKLESAMRKLGVEEYFTKPVQFDRLRNAMQEFIDLKERDWGHVGAVFESV